jgi:hypothetical protein
LKHIYKAVANLLLRLAVTDSKMATLLSKPKTQKKREGDPKNSTLM